MLHVLRQRNFLLLWIAGLVSMTGDWVLFTALPIYVYTLTRSPAATSLTIASSLLPSLLLGSLAGVFVDRWPRQRIMLLANILLAITLLPLLLVRSADLVWIVYLVGFLQSTIAQFFRPAEAAVLPTLVGEEMLVTANSLSSLSQNSARLLGPAIGGLIAVSTGIAGVTLIDAGSFAVAAILIALLVVPRSAAPGAAEGTQQASLAVWQEWLEGFRLVRGSTSLIVLMGIFGLSGLGEGVMSPIFVIWVKQLFHGSALQIGWFMSAQAVGGILGGLVIGALGSRIVPRRLAWMACGGFAVLDIALFSYPQAYSPIWLGLVLIALVGIPAAGSGSSLTTLLQVATPDAYRGRVFGALGAMMALTMLIGTAIAGALGSIVGPIALLNGFQGGSYLLATGVLVLMTGHLGMGARAVDTSPAKSA
jgi:MFS family permease